MNYYAVQVRTGKEEKFLKLAEKQIKNNFDDESIPELLWPRRRLFEKKAGKLNKALKPLYPGYIFYRGESVSLNLYRLLKQTPGFSRFLNSNSNIVAISGRDKELLEHFLKFGEIVEHSKVMFDENNKICVLSGPMRGMEGIIKRVDRRKKRAKIELSLNNNSMLVDLSFEVIQSAEANNGK